MKTLHIYEGFRFGDRVVEGKHFGDYSVFEDGHPGERRILTWQGIRNGVYEETGKFYDMVEFDEEEDKKGEQIMEKTLSLHFELHKDEPVKMIVTEGESGTSCEFELPFDPDEHCEFNETVGNEVWSWISLWMDELEEADEDE